jgi:NACalpha-BTF3-like transcription factor
VSAARRGAHSPQVLFVLATPELYKSPNSDCYIVFGEAKIEDVNQGGPLGGGPPQMAPQGARAPTLEQSGAADDDEVPDLEPAEEDGEVDETGVDPKDIDLVIAQTSCSRGKAVKALKESGGDLINASACARPPVCRAHAHAHLQSWPRASDPPPVVLVLACMPAKTDSCSHWACRRSST